MSDTQIQPVRVTFAGIESDVMKTTYPVGNATALVLTDARDGSPVTMATVNVPGTSEMLSEDTGPRVPTGFVGSPVVRILREIPDLF